jgi:SAM-dependent methyltransferase
MKALAQRSRAPELMEIETADFAEIDRTLRELSTINRLTLAYRPTLRWLDRVAARAGGAPLSILDVACGHGDMLRRVWRWAERRGLEVRLTGIDIDPLAVRSASAATPAGVPIRYEVADVFALPDEPAHDVIMSSLFAHHLFDQKLVAFVAWMERSARRSWVVNDLHRHPIPYHFVRHWVRLAGFGRFVVHDAPVSVARGFTRGEWLGVLAAAGVDPAQVEISWCMPFRYRVGRLR